MFLCASFGTVNNWNLLDRLPYLFYTVEKHAFFFSFCIWQTLYLHHFGNNNLLGVFIISLVINIWSLSVSYFIIFSIIIIKRKVFFYWFKCDGKCKKTKLVQLCCLAGLVCKYLWDWYLHSLEEICRIIHKQRINSLLQICLYTTVYSNNFEL